MGVGALAAGAFGLKAAADFEQTKIAFEGILGSAQTADTFLSKLRDFANKTPFEFPELAASAKNLLAVGFNAEDVIPIMTKLGNTAATLGVGGPAIEGVVRALGQMKGKGKASAEELNQISEQIPGFSAIGAIAEGMGVSVAEAFDRMAQGAVPADEAIGFILDGMERFPGAAGAMDRQSKTLAGSFSTLKDTVTQALVEVLTPALPALTKGVRGLAEVITTKIIPAFRAAMPVIGRVVEIMFEVGGWLIEHKPVLIAVAGAIAGPLVAAFIAWAIAAAQAAIATLIALAPIILIGAAVALLAYLIISNWDSIKAAFSAAARWIGDRINDIVGFFTALPGRIVGFLDTVRDWIVDRFRAARDSVLGFLGNIAQWFRDLPGNIVSWVGDLGSALYQAGKDLIAGLVRGILNGPSVGDAINKKLGPFSGQIGGIMNLFKASGGSVFPGQPYIVGEEGPEIFWPSMRGTIIPNSVTSSVLAAGPAVAPVVISGNTFLGTEDQTARWVGAMATRGQAARERRGGSLPLRSTRR